MGRLPAVLAATLPWSLALVLGRTVAANMEDTPALLATFVALVAAAFWLGPRWSLAVFAALTSSPGTNPYARSWHLTAGRGGDILGRILLLSLPGAALVGTTNALLIELWRALSRSLPGAAIGFGYDAAGIVVSSLLTLIILSSLAEIFLASGAKGEI